VTTSSRGCAVGMAISLQVDHDEIGSGVEGGECHRVVSFLGGPVAEGGHGDGAF
jgi:hypothetical protein